MNTLNRLVICLMLVFVPMLVQAAEPVGKVLLSIGKNTAQPENAAEGGVRYLKRLAPLYAGDRIQTSNRGRLQIRFSDSSLLSLKANSQFVVQEYQFDASAPRDGKAVYRLIKGGMRTVTGLIGREEKADYRLDTPVATIGIRGTHYSLYLCDAACAQTRQIPAGLVGGVAEGGIQVSNSTGGYGIGVDNFFFVADQDAPLQALLEPPALLAEEVSSSSGADTEAAESGASDSAQAETERTDNADSTGLQSGASSDSSTEGFAVSSVESPGELSQSVALPVTEPDSIQVGPDKVVDSCLVNTTDCDLAVTDPGTTDPGTTDPGTTDPGTTDPGTTDPGTGALAPDGAIMGVAFVDAGNGGGSQASGGLLRAGPSIAITVNTDNQLLDATISDPTIGPDDGGCNPCLINQQTALLENIGGVSGPGLGINWGRWRGSWSLDQNGTLSTALQDLHFIYSPNITDSQVVKGLTGAFSYDFVGGTSPTDEGNNIGSYGSVGSITVDFDSQMIRDIFFSADVAGKLVSANSLHSLVPIQRVLDGQPVALTGTCSGGSCVASTGTPMIGDISLAFVGPAAERMMASWGLFEDAADGSSSVAVSGTAVFDQSAALNPFVTTFAGPGSIVQLAYIYSNAPGEQKGQVISLNAEVDTAVVIDTTTGSGPVPMYTHFNAFDKGATQPCPNCEISSANGALAEEGHLSETGQAVHWGRWSEGWAASSDDPDQLRSQGDLHFAYSPDFTPDNVVTGLSGSFTYGLINGTSPTDHSGEAGAYDLTTGANQIQVDFGSQLVTSVNLAVIVSDRNYSFNAAGTTPIATLLNNQAVDLVGSCSGGSCGPSTAMIGGLGVDFVGPSAERLVTSFGAADNNATPTIAVTGAGVYQR